MEPFNKELLKNPHWTLRNKFISKNLDPEKSVLDLGCGEKDLLKYYKPSKYLGIDVVPGADRFIDLNNEFELETGWDYVINSGILEYLENLETYIKKIKLLGNTFIFTWYQGVGLGRPSANTIKEIIQKDYCIQKELDWGSQKIFICINSKLPNLK